MATPSPADLSGLTIQAFLNALADKTPTPGGGSVAAIVGSLAGAQLRMTIAYTLGRKKFAAVEPLMQSTAEAVDQITAEFLQLMQQDAAAYESLAGYLKMPPEQRTQKADFSRAARQAIDVPLKCAHAARQLIDHAAAIADKINPHLISDLGVAVSLAGGVLACCELNVRVNLPILPDKNAAAACAQEMHQLRRHAQETADLVDRQVRVIMPAAD